MTSPEKPNNATHELGRVYDAITDSKVLIEFFLMTVSRFIPASRSYLFLVTPKKVLSLEAALPSEAEIPEGVAEEVQKIFETGKSAVLNARMLLPLIARNSVMGVACFERAAQEPPFTSQDCETGFDLASEFSGALKNILLFEENVKMERLAAVGQAMGMVVHEIKNILQLARFSDEMTRMGIKEQNEKFITMGLAKMSKTFKEMDGLVREMLSLTKDYELEPEKINLAEILEELRSDLAERAAGLRIRLDFAAEPGFPVVEGDGRSLYRALLNLIKNAFEAFENNPEAAVKVMARIKSEDEDHYELIVEDNGPGMSEEVKAKLFEAFFSTKGKRGTGLGLMVVARTMKMHQGNVAVESQPGTGTKFILTLPRSFRSLKP